MKSPEKNPDQARLDWVLGAMKGIEQDARRVLILGAARGGKSHQVRVQVQVQDKPAT